MTDLQQKIYDYVKFHPGLTTEDIANRMDNTTEIYNAVEYLVWQLYVDRDPRTQALSIQE